MQSGGDGNRAAADMKLYAYIIDIGSIADFFAFRNAAGIAQVRLDNLQRAVFKIRRVLPPGIDALPAGQGKIQLA